MATKKKMKTPAKYGEVTKSFIEWYVDENGDEAVAWFVGILQDAKFIKEKDGKKDINIKEVRKEFCTHFEEFNHLLPKKKTDDDYVTRMMKKYTDA